MLTEKPLNNNNNNSICIHQITTTICNRKKINHGAEEEEEDERDPTAEGGIDTQLSSPEVPGGRGGTGATISCPLAADAFVMLRTRR